MNKRTDWTEEFLETIQLISDETVKQSRNHRIEAATIVEVKGKHMYTVDNDSIKYTAYGSVGSEYHENDRVYILIPQGDYEEKKIILGNYSYETKSDLNWVSPKDSFVDITGNIISSEASETTFELVANGKSNYNPNSQTNNNLQMFKNEKSITDYDTLYISAYFKTKFKEPNQEAEEGFVIKGNYGILLRGDEYDPNTKKSKKFYCFLDTKDMIGNLYSFDSYFLQEKKFQLNPKKIYKNLEVQFFQNINGITKKGVPIVETGGFKRLTTNSQAIEQGNKYVVYEPDVDDSGKQIPDLFMKKLRISFGYSLDSYDKETVYLYTLDDLDYDETDRTRRMRLRWIHFDSEGKPHSIENIEDEVIKDNSVRVHWYRYDLNADGDSLSGKGWKEIDNAFNNFSYTANMKISSAQEKFKVIITIDGNQYLSEILTFNNPSKQNKEELLEGINIVYPASDTNEGHFYFYSDVDNSASSGNTNKARTLETKLISKDNESDLWEDGDVLSWRIPANNTMIKTPEDGKEYDGTTDFFLEAGKDGTKKRFNNITFTQSENYHIVAKKVKKDTEDTKVLKYRLKRYFNKQKNKNTIYCDYYKSGEVKRNSTDKISFSFGTQGTNGSEFTLGVEWIETTQSGNKYYNPPAMTWSWDSSTNEGLLEPSTDANEKFLVKNNLDSTKTWEFQVSVIDKAGNVLKNTETKDDSWKVELSWYKAASLESDIKASDFMNLIWDGTIHPRIEIADVKNASAKYDFVKNLTYTLITIKATGKARGKNINLKKVLPIPFRKYRYLEGIRGPTEIVYDGMGRNPKMNDDEAYYLIRKNNHEKLMTKDWRLLVQDSNGKLDGWYPEWKNPQADNITISTDGYIKPAQLFTEHSSGSSGVHYSAVGVRARNDFGEYIWAQPIYVAINPYTVGFLNDWDGGLTINEEENSILSSVIGAGKKNSSNQFSGVVLGNLNDVDGVSGTGILGFRNGILSFSLKDDGTAIFGESGKGQIIINGQNGVIQSGNYNLKEKTGVKIELDDGDAFFGGTIWAKEGNIGDWTIEEGSLRSWDDENKIGAVFKAKGEIGLALGCTNIDQASTGVLHLYHNGDAWFGHNEAKKTTGLKIMSDGSIEGMHWAIDVNGNAHFGINKQKTKTRASVDITGIRVANDGAINGKGWDVDIDGNATFNNIYINGGFINGNLKMKTNGSITLGEGILQVMNNSFGFTGSAFFDGNVAAEGINCKSGGITFQGTLDGIDQPLTITKNMLQKIYNDYVSKN